MEKNDAPIPSSVNALPARPQTTFISDELRRIRDILLSEFPEAVHVSFDFADKLSAHIDVRAREDVAAVESRLPTLGAGMFCDVRRASTPKHPFYYRISAQVLR